MICWVIESADGELVGGSHDKDVARVIMTRLAATMRRRTPLGLRAVEIEGIERRTNARDETEAKGQADTEATAARRGTALA